MLCLWRFKDFPSIDQITDKIFISNDVAAYSKKVLQKNKITHIIVVATSREQKFPNDFKYLQLPIIDMPTQRLLPYLQMAFDFIEKGEKVLVHCGEGISRSPSIVIAYLMAKNKWKYDVAFNYVSQKRSVAWPNKGFVAQLKEFEKSVENEEFELTSKPESQLTLDIDVLGKSISTAPESQATIA